jgi:predicted transcriptional regulator
MVEWTLKELAKVYERPVKEIKIVVAELVERGALLEHMNPRTHEITYSLTGKGVELAEKQI